MRFDFKKTKIYPALKWNFLFKVNKVVFYLLFIPLLGSLLLFIFPSLSFYLPFGKGVFFIVFPLIVSTRLFELFFDSYLKKPLSKKVTRDVLAEFGRKNLASYLDFETSKAVFTLKNRRRPFSSSRLALELLAREEGQFVLQRLLIPFNKLKRDLKRGIKKEEELGEESFKRTMVLAFKSALERENGPVRTSDVLFALAKRSAPFQETLITHDLYPRDVRNLAHIWERTMEKIEEGKKFWKFKNLLRKGSLGRDFAAGYTLVLDSFSTNLTKTIERMGEVELVGRRREMKRLERLLSNDETDNVLLVGPQGCGREALVLALASKMTFGETSEALNYKRVLSLKGERIVSQAEDRETVLKLLERVFKEATSVKNTVIVIENIHDLLVTPERGGLFDASGMLANFMDQAHFKLIGVSNPVEFHRKIEPKSSVDNLFEKVHLGSMSKEETILVLQRNVPFFEAEKDLFIPYPVLRDIVNYADKFLTEYAFPEKALKLLSETASHVETKKDKRVTREDVAEVVSQKTKVPVGKIGKEEREVLLNLESLIHKRLIDQEEAVREISEALRRRRSKVGKQEGPIGTFLFMGPTGVGKTETAKSLARVYFGDKKRMIRFDMSEFQNKEDIKRLIGDRNESGRLSEEVRSAPFSLLLLDEIEKAHPDILNVFLHILDEGYFTDGMGREVSLKNTIIIGTSNAGYKLILEGIEKGISMPKIKEKIISYVFDRGIFRPEFVNRFDAVVIFKALSQENLLDIAGIMLGDLQKRLKEENFIDLLITDKLKQKVVELSYEPRFGAREMKRVIQDKVEDALAEAILAQKIKKGDQVRVDENFKVLKI